MTTHPLAGRFASPGSKRILALDGGGVRGIVSLAFLERIEAALRIRFANPQMVLSDYFDLIGGTSVGAMIATMLAMGKDVAHIRKRFEEWAPRMFDQACWGIMGHVYDARVLRGLVQTEVLDWPLKTDKLQTGLCIIAKRADTGSVWAFVNNPAGPYFERRPGTGNGPATIGNGDYKLLDLIRASTAAPRYFTPASLDIQESGSTDEGPVHGHFVDGGVSPHNMPALKLFMMAGMTGYNLGGGELEPRGERRAWKLGAQNLLVISVGTGTYDNRAERSRLASLDAVYALQGMIADGQQLALAMLQWMSVPNRSWHIDGIMGDLSCDLLGDGAGLQQPLMAFQRYDVMLHNDWLLARELTKAPLSDAELDGLRNFTNAAAIPELARIASAAAAQQIAAEDFPSAFDQLWRPRSETGPGSQGAP